MKNRIIFIGVQLFMVSCIFWTCKSDKQEEEPQSVLTNEIKPSNIKFDIKDYNMNGIYEVDEELKFQPRNIYIGAEKYKWEFGNGDILYEKYPMYSYSKGGRYLVTLTIDGSERTEKEIAIKNVIKSSPSDSVIILRGDRNVFVDEKIVFKAHVSGAEDWDWDFGAGGGWTTKSKMGQVIHSYKEPRTYIVKVRTDLNEYPDTHRIVVHPRFKEIQDDVPVDSLQLVADDIKMRLQRIADSPISDFQTIRNERKEIEDRYLCGDVSKVVIKVNGFRYNDFYNYCNGIHHLDSPEEQSLLIDDVKIDTIKCMQIIEVSQSESQI